MDIMTDRVFHWGNCTRVTGPRGGVKTHIVECRRTGVTKTWKTRPGEFRVPIKRGLREYGEIVPENVAQFHTPEECPLNDGHDHGNLERHNARVQDVIVPALMDAVYHRGVCTCGWVTQEASNITAIENAVSLHMRMGE